MPISACSIACSWICTSSSWDRDCDRSFTELDLRTLPGIPAAGKYEISPPSSVVLEVEVTTSTTVLESDVEVEVNAGAGAVGDAGSPVKIAAMPVVALGGLREEGWDSALR